MKKIYQNRGWFEIIFDNILKLGYRQPQQEAGENIPTFIRSVMRHFIQTSHLTKILIATNLNLITKRL